MNRYGFIGLLSALFTVSVRAATIEQVTGATHVAFEAERQATTIAGSPTTWQVRADTTASGRSALEAAGLDFVGASPHGFVVYDIKFATAGTYYFYYRWRADPLRTASDPFVANSSWIPQRFGVFTTAGPAGQGDFLVSASNGTSAPANGSYRWQAEPGSVAFVVTESQVSAGAPLALTIATREAGMIFDRFILSTAANLTATALDALPNSEPPLPKPEALRAVGSESLSTVRIEFSRDLNSATVALSDFSLNGGLVVYRAEMIGTKSVLLETSPQTQNTRYTVTVGSVSDLSGTPSTPGSTIAFTAWREARGWLTREVYRGIPGVTMASLTAAAKFPAQPDQTDWVKGFDLHGAELGQNLGARLRGKFHPATSGVYEFFHANHHEAEILLSFDETPDFLLSLGVVPAVSAFEPTRFFTFPIGLMAGSAYLIEARVKQGPGEASLALAARRQGTASPVSALRPIHGDQVSTYVNPDLGAVAFQQHPAGVTVTEGSRAQFEVVASSPDGPMFYQWRRNGLDIEGATGRMLVLESAGKADHGGRYSVVIGVAGRDTVSNEAVLNVIDGVAPSLTISSPAPGTLRLGWPAAAAGYRLVFTDQLRNDAEWSAVPGVPALLNAAGSFDLAVTGQARYYQLVK